MRKIRSGFDIIWDSLWSMFFSSRISYFPSAGMTADAVFRENVILFLSNSKNIETTIYYFGKIDRNKMRFALFLNDNVSLVKVLCSIIMLGGNLLFLDKNDRETLITRGQILWRRKIRKHIATSKKINIFHVYRNNSKIVEFSSLYAVEIDIWRTTNGKIYTTNAINGIQNLIDINRANTEEIEIYGYATRQFVEVKSYNFFVKSRNV